MIRKTSIVTIHNKSDVFNFSIWLTDYRKNKIKKKVDEQKVENRK